MKAFCADCHTEIDTKKHNVGRDNRIVICPDCVQIRCSGAPTKPLNHKRFKQGKRARGK